MRVFSPSAVRAFEWRLCRGPYEVSLGHLIRLATDSEGSINKQIAALNVLSHRIYEIVGSDICRDIRILAWEIQLTGDAPALRIAAQEVERRMLPAHRYLN